MILNTHPDREVWPEGNEEFKCRVCNETYTGGYHHSGLFDPIGYIRIVGDKTFVCYGCNDSPNVHCEDKAKFHPIERVP